MVSNCPLLGPVADRVPDCISVIKGEIFFGGGEGGMDFGWGLFGLHTKGMMAGNLLALGLG